MNYNEWTPKQIEAYHATRKYLYTLFGGAKGGGKSVGGARIIQCDVSNYRNGIFIVMRKNYTVLRNTTVRTFEKFFDPDLIIRKANNKWYLANNNQIWFVAADRTRDPDYEKTRGYEGTAIMVDEASEGDQQLYELLPSLLRQPATDIDTLKPWTGNVYMTSNPVPGTNYLKTNFIDPRTRKNDGTHCFIRSLPDDNSLLPEGYIERAFGNMNETLKRMLRYGDWDVDESEFQIVPNSSLETIMWTNVIQGKIIAAGIDIGLGRPDQTVVYVVDENGHFSILHQFAEYDTVRQTSVLRGICDVVRANNGEVWIDAGAVGKGVADQLTAEFGNRVIRAVTFGEAAELEEDGHKRVYENRRSQLYFWAREDMMSAAAQVDAGDIPAITLDPSEQLTEELINTFYLPADGRLRIEPKDAIKARLGRSPDHADAFVLCNAARRSIKSRPFYVGRAARQERRSRKSTTTMGY